MFCRLYLLIGSVFLVRYGRLVFKLLVVGEVDSSCRFFFSRIRLSSLSIYLSSLFGFLDVVFRLEGD